MKKTFGRVGILVVSALLPALFVWPAAAANAVTNDDFLAMTNSQAEELEMPAAVSVQQSQQAAATATTEAEQTEIRAAHLGVMTPYGKRALVQELRNYYPGSYREFRSLSSDQVNELVVLFEQSGSLNQVLAHMDDMVVQ